MTADLAKTKTNCSFAYLPLPAVPRRWPLCRRQWWWWQLWRDLMAPRAPLYTRCTPLYTVAALTRHWLGTCYLTGYWQSQVLTDIDSAASLSGGVALTRHLLGTHYLTGYWQPQVLADIDSAAVLLSGGAALTRHWLGTRYLIEYWQPQIMTDIDSAANLLSGGAALTTWLDTDRHGQCL